MPAVAHDVEFSPGEFPVLLGYACVAIYGCVPETDQMPTMGLMALGLFVIERITKSSSVPVVKVVALAIVLWSGLYGATGRESAVIGALFAFWPLVLVTGFALAAAPLAVPARWVIGAIGAVASVSVARTGAIEPTTEPAVVAVAIAVPVSLLAAWLVVAVSRRVEESANRR